MKGFEPLVLLYILILCIGDTGMIMIYWGSTVGWHISVCLLQFICH